MTILVTRSATSPGPSCSQTLITAHPASASRESVSASRCRFRSILDDQYSGFALVRGLPCCGQPCQKHPPMKTATRVGPKTTRSEEHTSELQSRGHLVCRLLLEKKKQ